MPRRRRLPSPSIFPRPPPKSIIVRFGPVKGQNSSTAPDERVAPPAICRRRALLLSSRSSKLSCRCLSSRLHRPSRYYLKGGVRSPSPSRALGQRRIFPSFHGPSGSPWGFPPNSFGSSGRAPAIFIGTCGVYSRQWYRFHASKSDSSGIISTERYARSACVFWGSPPWTAVYSITGVFSA